MDKSAVFTKLCTYVTPAISTKVFLYHLSILSHLDFKPRGTVLMYLKRYFKPTEANRNSASLWKAWLGFKQILELRLLHSSSQKQDRHNSNWMKKLFLFMFLFFYLAVSVFLNKSRFLVGRQLHSCGRCFRSHLLFENSLHLSETERRCQWRRVCVSSTRQPLDLVPIRQLCLTLYYCHSFLVLKEIELIV